MQQPDNRTEQPRPDFVALRSAGDVVDDHIQAIYRRPKVHCRFRGKSLHAVPVRDSFPVLLRGTRVSFGFVLHSLADLLRLLIWIAPRR
jgi:hypothetical protein